MLIIGETQMAAIKVGVRRRLARRIASAARLAVAGSPQNAHELEAIADEVQRFAETHRIFLEANLHKLMILRLGTEWCEPLPALAGLFLTRDGFDETTRVEQFREALLRPPQLSLIDLDTPIGPPPQ